MKNEGISIIICCYNSEKVIEETLEHIFAQNIDNSISWEVILVNNASTDNTFTKANEKWSESSTQISFRIIDESHPGKSNALKKGLDAAMYEFILICDDDNLLQSNYLETAYNIMMEHPEIGFLGGCGSARTEGSFPDWFQNFKNVYACGSQTQGGNDITKEKEYVYGAGAMFRKSIFEGLDADNYLRVLPGRKKGNLVGGEDNLMGYIAVIAGYRIWYSDRLKFIHKISQDRLKWDYLTNVKYANGRAQIYLDPFTNYIRNNKSPKGFASQIITNVIHILSLIKNDGFDLFKKKEGNKRNLILYYYLGKTKELIKLNFSYQKEYQKNIEYCKLIESRKHKALAADCQE